MMASPKGARIYCVGAKRPATCSSIESRSRRHASLSNKLSWSIGLRSWRSSPYTFRLWRALFGMNVEEIQDNFPSIWTFFVVAFFVSVTLLVLAMLSRK
jgi:hypothetical protein